MAAKIYEFSLLDKYNTPKEDIICTVEQTLATEADLQGWVPGYTYQQVSTPSPKQSGEIEYSFVVYGDFVSVTGDGQSNQTDGKQTPQSVTAAKPAEL